MCRPCASPCCSPAPPASGSSTCLLRRVAGERAAVFGCGLLAADSLYLLTICFDWGPVALQHLLLARRHVLLVGFYQERSHRRLAWGCFLLGLAMWDKALAIWMLGGMGVALLIVFPRQILRRYSRRAASASPRWRFALGALPLIVYNVHNPLATFRGNTSWDTSDLAGKGRLLRGTADGSALFGWLNLEDWQTARAAPAARRHGIGICQDFGTCRASASSPAALRVPARPAAHPSGARQRTARHPFRAAGDGGRLGADGRHRQRRRQRTPCHPALAAAADGHRDFLCRRLAPPRRCRYSGTRRRSGGADDLRPSGDQRIPLPDRAQRRQPELDRRHLPPLRLHEGQLPPATSSASIGA